MSLPMIKVAVVGHTNTGKTSLLRTLTRDVGFGEVSNRAATTRHVEGTTLAVDGEPLVELYDTPGLEDSMGLLEHIDELRGDRHNDWIDIIEQFLGSPEAQGEFEQEAKVLRQVMASDIALYVIDARDRVLGRHRDELEILGRCARPVVPVLNFVTSDEAKTDQWREHLARVNMHAVVEFDTVVLTERGEQRLFEKMQTLLDPFRDTLAALIQDRINQRRALEQAAADVVADLLIDIAAYTLTLPAEATQTQQAMTGLKQQVRKREQQCVDDLLELFRFRIDDYASDDLPIEGGHWGMDLFNPEALRQFGVRTGSGAAAGAAAGLGIDVLAGGLTLGAAAALGATLGAIWSGSRSHGRRIADRMRGYTELRVDDATLRLLATRQLDLVRALLVRGHASQDRIRLQKSASDRYGVVTELPEFVQRARANPNWSRLAPQGQTYSNGHRHELKEQLAGQIAKDL